MAGLPAVLSLRTPAYKHGAPFSRSGRGLPTCNNVSGRETEQYKQRQIAAGERSCARTRSEENVLFGSYWWVTSTSVRDPVTSTVFSIGSAPAYTVTAYMPGTTCGISNWPLESARATYGDDAA